MSMHTRRAKHIKKLESHYTLGDYECLFFPRVICKIWPWQVWGMRVIALILFIIYIGIILTMHGYRTGILLWEYKRIFATPTPSNQIEQTNSLTVGGIQINLNKRTGVFMRLTPGGYVLKPNKFSLVPVGKYTLNVKSAGYLNVQRPAIISKSVVYKDYLYLPHNPVYLRKAVSLPGHFFVKVVDEKIIACNNTSVIILTSGIERLLNIVNYKIDTIYINPQSSVKNICSTIKQAEVIKIKNNRIIAIVRTGSKTVNINSGFILKEYDFSEGSKISTSLYKNYRLLINQASNVVTKVTQKQYSINNLPAGYTVEDLGNRLVLYYPYFAMGRYPVYSININPAIKIDKKEFNSYYGKIQIIKGNLVLLTLTHSSLGTKQINVLDIYIYDNADFRNLRRHTRIILPDRIFYDLGFLGDLHHFYLLDTQQTLLVFSDTKPEIQDSALLAYVHKQIEENSSYGQVQPFVFSLRRLDVSYLPDSFNSLNANDKSKSNAVPSLFDRFPYIYEMPLDGEVLQFAKSIQKPLNDNCVIWNKNIFCMQTNNITSLLPGRYKLPVLTETSASQDLQRINIYLINNSLIVYLSTQNFSIKHLESNYHVFIPVTYLGIEKAFKIQIALQNLVEDSSYKIKELQLEGIYRNSVQGTMWTSNGKNEKTLIIVGKL